MLVSLVLPLWRPYVAAQFVPMTPFEPQTAAFDGAMGLVKIVPHQPCVWSKPPDKFATSQFRLYHRPLSKSSHMTTFGSEPSHPRSAELK